MKLTIPQKRPMRFFNITGPCFPWDHDMMPPEERLINAQLDRYISDSLYVGSTRRSRLARLRFCRAGTAPNSMLGEILRTGRN